MISFAGIPGGSRWALIVAEQPEGRKALLGGGTEKLELLRLLSGRSILGPARGSRSLIRRLPAAMRVRSRPERAVPAAAFGARDRVPSTRRAAKGGDPFPCVEWRFARW